MQGYLVIWNPANKWPIEVNSMRIVGAFATDGGLPRARKITWQNAKDYAQEIDGHIRVVKSNGAEFLVEAHVIHTMKSIINE